MWISYFLTPRLMPDRNGGGCFSRSLLKESEAFRGFYKELSLARLCWACSESTSRAHQGAAISHCLFITAEEGVRQMICFHTLMG